MRRHAGTGTGAACGRVRGSDIGIGSVIDIKKRSLGALEQNLFPALERAMEINDRVGNERPQFPAGLEVMFVDLPIVNGLRAQRLKDAVIFADLRLKLFRE